MSKPPSSGDGDECEFAWDRELAQFLHMHAVADPNEGRRPWYKALLNHVQKLRVPRKSRVLTDPFVACLEFVSRTGAIYYEGLVIREQDKRRPQPAIWASLPEAIVCFSHDLSAPHGIQGMPFSDSAISLLFHDQGIRGPYLFHENPLVLEQLVPLNRRIIGGGPARPPRGTRH